MSEQELVSETPVQAITDNDVLLFLQQNSDFLQNHMGVIEQQNFDHGCGDAASILELQVKMLRDRLQDCTNKLSELVQTARNNDVQFERTKLLVTELSGSTSIKAVTQALRFNFFSEFNADALRLIMLQDMAEVIPDLISVPQEHENYKKWTALAQTPWAFFCQVEDPLLAALFTEDNATPMRSCALLPMHKDKQPFAIIVIASKRENYYTEQLDTLFLNHVAAVCSRALSRIGS